MFFTPKSKEQKPSRPPYCVVPMPKPMQKAHKHCHEHAHLLSDFLRRHKLHEHRFDFVQRTQTAYDIEGDVLFHVDLITEDLVRKCILKVSGDKGGTWVYVLRHAEHSPNEIYNILFDAFGKKTKVFPKNPYKEAMLRFRNRFSQ